MPSSKPGIIRPLPSCRVWFWAVPPLKGYAFQQALVVDVHDVALDGRTLVGHQLGGGMARRRSSTASISLSVTSGSDALGLEAGGLGQVQLGLQGGGGGGHKALVLFHADQVVDRARPPRGSRVLPSLRRTVPGTSLSIKSLMASYQKVCSPRSASIWARSASPLAKPLIVYVGAGALVHRVGCGFQFFGRWR